MDVGIKSIYFPLVFCVILFTSSCDYYDSRLLIVNQSDRDISYVYSQDTVRSIPNVNRIAYYRRIAIPSHDSSYVTLPGGVDEWNRFIENSQNKKLNLFFYDLKVLWEHSSIDTVNSRGLYLKKTGFSIEELESNNWRVIYKE